MMIELRSGIVSIGIFVFSQLPISKKDRKKNKQTDYISKWHGIIICLNVAVKLVARMMKFSDEFQQKTKNCYLHH